MTSSPTKTIVIVGLSGAGLKTFNLLLDKLHPCSTKCPAPKNVRVIAIDKSQYAFWAPGSLRAAVVSGFEDKIVGNLNHLVPARIKKSKGDLVKVVTGTEVLEIDLENRVVLVNRSLESFGIEGGDKIAFDYLVIGSGSSYAFPCRPPTDADMPAALKAKFQELQRGIEQSDSILIVGAGVVGIEFAGEVSSQYKQKRVTLVGSSPALLTDYSHHLAHSLEQQLLDRGVKIVYGHRADLNAIGVTKTTKLDTKTKIDLIATGDQAKQEVEADFVFLATGNHPNTNFMPKEYLDHTTKLIRVNSNLQVINGTTSEPVPGVYALGDATDFKESKLFAALDGQASTVSKNLLIDITHPISQGKVIHKPFLGTIVIPLGPSGGGSQLFGFTFGLGAFATSVIKGKSLFVGMFKSMYPDKDR